MRYTLAIAALPVTYACHCLACQTASGSAFAQQALVQDTAIELTGPVVEYAAPGANGAISRQRFCATCHTRLYNTNDGRPGVVVVRAGTLDDSHLLKVGVHIWTSRKQSWLGLPAETVTFDENGTLAALGPLFARRI